MSVSRQGIGHILHVPYSHWIKTTDIHLNVTARDENWVRQLLKIYINFWGKAYVIVGIMMDWWENLKVYFSKLLSLQIIATSDTRLVKQFFRKMLKFLFPSLVCSSAALSKKEIKHSAVSLQSL